MTGEITLRGLVLPIGGLKEKSLAAMRAGISTVIIPKLNEKDLVDVPEEAKQKLKFVPVENVDEVLGRSAGERRRDCVRFGKQSCLTREYIKPRALLPFPIFGVCIALCVYCVSNSTATLLRRDHSGGMVWK